MAKNAVNSLEKINEEVNTYSKELFNWKVVYITTGKRIFFSWYWHSSLIRNNYIYFLENRIIISIVLIKQNHDTETKLNFGYLGDYF